MDVSYVKLLNTFPTRYWWHWVCVMINGFSFGLAQDLRLLNIDAASNWRTAWIGLAWCEICCKIIVLTAGHLPVIDLWCAVSSFLSSHSVSSEIPLWFDICFRCCHVSSFVTFVGLVCLLVVGAQTFDIKPWLNLSHLLPAGFWRRRIRRSGRTSAQTRQGPLGVNHDGWWQVMTIDESVVSKFHHYKWIYIYIYIIYDINIYYIFFHIMIYN